MLFYKFARSLAAIMLRIGGMRIIGRENIPKDEKVIVIANHISFGDVPALSYAIPYPMSYIAKESFSKNFMLKHLFSAAGVLFLKADESDIGAMREAVKVLRSGKAVAIFPEGTRRFDQNITEFKPGASYMAYRSGAVVLPVGLLNTGDYWRFWRRNVLVNIGRPIELAKGEKLSQEYLDRYNKMFFDAVAALVEENKQIITKEGKKMRKPPKKHI